VNLELVVFWSRELLVTDVAVLVFVVVAEDFLNQVSLLLEELLNVLRLVATLRFDLLNLFVEVIVELFPGDLHVCVGVDLLEDVDGGGSVGDVEELDVEVEGGSPWDHLTGSLIAIAQLWRHDQLPLLAHAHANDTLVPTLDHLPNPNLELKWLVPVDA